MLGCRRVAAAAAAAAVLQQSVAQAEVPDKASILGVVCAQLMGIALNFSAAAGMMAVNLVALVITVSCCGRSTRRMPLCGTQGWWGVEAAAAAMQRQPVGSAPAESSNMPCWWCRWGLRRVLQHAACCAVDAVGICSSAVVVSSRS